MSLAEYILMQKSALISSALGGVDFAGLTTDVFKFSEDMSRTAEIVKQLQAAIAGATDAATKLLTMAQKSSDEIMLNAANNIVNTVTVLEQQIRNSAAQSAAGFNQTSAMMQQLTKITATLNFADMYSALALDIPQTMIKAKATYWYNKKIRPAIASEELAIEQFIRDNWSATKTADILASHGIPDDDAMALYDHDDQYPSIRQAAMASMYFPIDDATLRNLMKYSFITQPFNIDFYMNYAHSIQLRSEFTAYLQILKADYTSGYITRKDFQDEIAAHKPNPNEQAQILINADNALMRQLLNMEVQSQTWLYRKGVLYTLGQAETPKISGEQYFYNDLVLLGVDTAMANAIVRLEACKLGVNWERS